MNTLKVIISGGGTGGHIYPAIAIANAIKESYPEASILFVGALGKMEMEKVPKAGYEIIGLPIAGINRSNILANIGFPLKVIKSLWSARKIVKDFAPDVAVGVGGYASGPLLFAASMSGVPILIQEQNSYAGITNKFLSKYAKKICVAYPEMETFFDKNKIIQTGNPVRKDIVDVSTKRNEALRFFGLSDKKKTLLVIGGSQGAKSINEAIYNGVQNLTEEGYQIIWQTGKLFTEKAEILATFNNSLYTSAFIYEMDLAYAAADVVVSRAGALSVSELCLAKKPAILVPLKTAAEDHQTKNAMSLVNIGAALLVKDDDTQEHLVKTALTLLSSSYSKSSCPIIFFL